MTDEPKAGEGKQQFFDEIVWAVQRSRLLFDYWTMPLLADTKPSGSEDIVSTRAFALLVIVALTFAVRGEPLGGTISYSVLASAVAAALSFGLNALSKITKVTVREPALVSAYASTILVMLGFLVMRSLEGLNWYDFLSDYIGTVPTAACLSAATIYVMLVLKAVFWDKNKLSFLAARQGLEITVGSGVIVVVVYFISNDGFDRVIRLFCMFNNSCK
jgi:hypothetical protein